MQPDWTRPELTQRSSFAVRIYPAQNKSREITIRNVRTDRPGWFEWKAENQLAREVLEPGESRVVAMPFTVPIELTLGFGLVLE